LLDAAGGLDRETWTRAQAESTADLRLRHLRHAPENDLLGVIRRLSERRFLPAIYFIFSRRGCREALQRCAGHGLDFTTDVEKDRIDRTLVERLDRIADRDEAQLFQTLIEADVLRRGFAMHHAGLLPYVKETIEELFQEGLIKVVFATETLSLGIHMPAKAVAVSSFTKFDGVNFSTLTSGELTQLMGRAGRRGIDPIGHGVILKESEVDIGTIYEAAISDEMSVESKFAPTYNMALNLLRFHSPEEVDRLMEQSFGQYQKLLAGRAAGERLELLRERLSDLDLERFQHPTEPCSERTIASWMHAEEESENLRGRMRRARRDHWHRRGRRRAAREAGGRPLASLKTELQEWQHRQHQLPCRNCPYLSEHRLHHRELRQLQAQVKTAEQELERIEGEYRRRMQRLRQILEELGFLEGAAPTQKGLLASRIYGDNTLVITQAIEDGWLEELTPCELAAALVTVTAEDRGRDRPPSRPRPPTAGVALTVKRLRIIYYRFSARERERGEAGLRPPSGDHVGFVYDWCSGTPLTELQPPPGVELGDAIKALKGLYSTLRQIEWAVAERPGLRRLVSSARECLERDLLTRV
jgi:ATP-dependent RNA helicase HelY